MSTQAVGRSVKAARAGVGYICQFCGVQSPARQWKQGGHECPKCGRLYDAIIALDGDDE